MQVVFFETCRDRLVIVPKHAARLAQKLGMKTSVEMSC